MRSSILGAWKSLWVTKSANVLATTMSCAMQMLLAACCCSSSVIACGRHTHQLSLLQPKNLF